MVCVMKPNPPLYPSQEKLKFAKSEFRNLVGNVNAFIGENPCEVRQEVNMEKTSFYASCPTLIPSEISIRACVVTNQLRDSLDKMLVAVVALNGKGTSGVSFPFGGKDLNSGKVEQFPTARHDRIKKKLTADQWSLVLAQKPYPNGNDLLWSINQIANTDKHRRDLVSILPEIDRNVIINNGNLRDATIGGGPIINENGSEVLLLSFREGNNINIELSPKIVFGEIEPVQRKNVLTTLNQQIRLTEGIIKVFKEAFF